MTDMNKLGNIVRIAGVSFLLTGAIFPQGCSESRGAGDSKPSPSQRASVSADGLRISFPAGSSGRQQIGTTLIQKGTVTIPVIAPSRVVAGISHSLGHDEKLITFESAEVTSLFSQYRQSKSNVTRTVKNLERLREMFDNQAATMKDLNEAENEAAVARASMAEFEGRLRAAGFNPVDLESALPGTVWLLSDVPESSLHEVQKGEDVTVTFASFPGKVFSGRADAISDVVDPATRTVKVRVVMPNPHGLLLPGMFARVDYGDPVQGMVLLPASAVATVEGKDYAFVQAAPDTFERREVTVANSSSNELVISGGLNGGEHVVTRGTMLLKGLSFGY